MPLTPNGKIDRARLPFPDTALQVTKSGEEGEKATEGEELSTLEKKLRSIWASVLGISPETKVGKKDNFFLDLGGHSILATRLLFEMR